MHYMTDIQSRFLECLLVQGNEVHNCNGDESLLNNIKMSQDCFVEILTFPTMFLNQCIVVGEYFCL